jgi:glycosyltransferase involved in cell wall biosynthesis
MNNSLSPLVSILTPVYNGAEYLSECIESVLGQTYQNWDYIIVDNCSTDGSAGIARRYAAQDRRIRVRENQRFLRANPNFNHALRQISPASKYCKMIFADDWMFPECLEQMVAIGEEHPTVGIIGAYSLQGRKVNWAGLPYPSRRVCGRELCRQLFLEELYVLGSASTMLYRSDLVRSRDPFYNEANMHADTEACIALLRTWDFGFVHQVLTFTRDRPGSLSTISTELNTHIAGSLYALVTYGRDYLTTKEFDQCIKGHLFEYYRFLGKNLLFGRDSRFWQYHKRKLTEAGIGFSKLRLAGAFLGTLCEAALNPKDSIKKLLKRRRRGHLADCQQHGSEPAVVHAQQ